MSYINVGARDISTNADIPSKRELKGRVATYPDKVEFYGTSDFEPFSGTASELVIGVKYSVTGPNPYNNRKWYATVERTAKGIKVS